MIVHVALEAVQVGFISNISCRTIHVKLHVTDTCKNGTETHELLFLAPHDINRSFNSLPRTSWKRSNERGGLEVLL